MNTNFENMQFGEVGYSRIHQLWNEKTGKFIIWYNRSSVKFWHTMDYYSILDGNVTDIGRLFLLIQNIDYDNYVCFVDKHSHRQVPINDNEHLMTLLNIGNRNTLKKFLDKLLKNEIIAITHITDYDGTKYKRFVINPLFGMKSNGISPSLYKLFYKTIAPQISTHARTCLASLVAEQEGRNDKLTMTPMDIFNKYVLRGCKPITYTLNEQAMVPSKIQKDKDIYFSVNGIKKDLRKKASNQDVIEYRNWFVDIDAGEDEYGKYFSDEEVLMRKQYMRETVLKSLPTPTLIVETRNGYQIYWSCIKGVSADDWNRLELKLHDTISVADPVVKDASRVLRMPNTTWVKPGKNCAPFKVKPILGNPVQYSVEDFEAILNTHAEKIAESCRTYTHKYPIINPKKSSKNISTHNNKIAPIRIVNNTLGVKEAIYDSSRAREIARSIDIAKWLCIDKTTSFSCILPDHEDQHPSATIYHNDDHDRYLCHCCNDGRGLDSIDLAIKLYGFSYHEAVEYLCKLQGFDYKAKQRKFA